MSRLGGSFFPSFFIIVVSILILFPNFTVALSRVGPCSGGLLAVTSQRALLCSRTYICKMVSNDLRRVSWPELLRKDSYTGNIS